MGRKRLSDEDLDAIEQRARAVGVEPWDVPWRYEEGAVLDAHNDIICETLDDDTADFIVHSIEDVPVLIAEIRRLRDSASNDALAALRDMIHAVDASAVLSSYSTVVKRARRVLSSYPTPEGNDDAD